MWVGDSLQWHVWYAWNAGVRDSSEWNARNVENAWINAIFLTILETVYYTYWRSISGSDNRSVPTSDADILANGLEVAHDPRWCSKVVNRERPRFGTERQTDSKPWAAADAALRLTTRVVPDPQRRVASHERLDEFAEIVSIVEFDGDLVPRLFHRVVTCAPSPRCSEKLAHSVLLGGCMCAFESVQLIPLQIAGGSITVAPCSSARDVGKSFTHMMSPLLGLSSILWYQSSLG